MKCLRLAVHNQDAQDSYLNILIFSETFEAFWVCVIIANNSAVCFVCFQCPKIKGVKTYTKEIDRRQVILDVQIWYYSVSFSPCCWLLETNSWLLLVTFDPLH